VNKNLLKIDQVAEMLATQPKTVKSWTSKGLLGAVKFGRTIRYRPEDVQHFIDKKLARHIAAYMNQAWEHRKYYTGQHSMADIILEALGAYEREENK
jgi:excisionase family DNA binding protein|tara:strand:+ start:832 stop:1122 length:291 start_codon:yes stop_codon:yes gene_type:complete